MFATIADVLAITGVVVTDPDIFKAQAIIESVAGRPEELIPLTSTTDLLWLKRATAWQCAYMKDDPVSVFEQANVESVTEDGGFKMVFGDNLVALAPLAEQAIGNLSWKKSRNIKTKPFDYLAEKWRQDRQTDWLREEGLGWEAW